MLRYMRTGAQSWIIKIFLFGMLLLATLGLAVMDYRGMFQSGFKPTTVAEVAGDKISSVEFDQLLQGALRRQKMKPADAYRTGYPAQYLQNEINSRLLSKAVHDYGIYVSDYEAGEQIKAILRSFPREGVTEKEALQSLLYNLGVNERTLVENQKMDIGLNLLMRALTVGIKAPEQMANDAMKFQAESRRGEHFTITAEDAGKADKPTEEELKAFYEKISSRFLLPEYRTVAMLVIDASSLATIAKPTEEELKAYYDAHKEAFTLPETRNVSQLVVEKAEDAKAIFEDAKKNGDLKKTADAHKGKARFVPAATFAQAEIPVEITGAFTAEQGAVLEPAETPLGWIIARVDAINAPHQQDYEAVKKDVQKELEDERANDNAEAVYKRINEIDDMAAGGKSLADIAQSLNLKEVVVEKVAATGIDENGKKVEVKVPLFDKVLEYAFKMQQAVVSEHLEAPTGEIVLAEVRDIIPAKEQPFEKVRAEVTKAWQLDKHSAALDQASAKILDRLKLGEDFESVAKSFGKKVTRTDMILRSDHAKAAAMPKGMFPALFALEKTGQVTVVGSGGEDATILRLADRTIDEKRVPKPEDVKSVRDMLDHAVQKDLLEEFRMSLMSKYNVKIHEEVLADMYKDKGEDDGTGSN